MTWIKRYLDILQCPSCGGDLEFLEYENKLLCKRCGESYPIVEDIPVLLKK
ncbi:MAG TPA: Trm112 family protein [Methanothermococcus okinawensis]|uniref:Trm112 family protein n=1 Tax=Methanothermococcus okinawensis TaxID=155863 RepID=A0A832ZAE0_9EURY|nr:Trm112 family protein [Methanococcaceae archaeon]HIP84115.1 Trm112 family protein [Methanothermococcus okinawensis]HIP91661.1 Trm112 family protein [Methanothermococcus okinawensis]